MGSAQDGLYAKLPGKARTAFPFLAERGARFALLCTACAVILFAAPAAGEDRPLLILGVDGVSLPVASEVWRQGGFEGFHPPAGLVAPFPSLTDVSLAGILDGAKVPGYEEVHFDVARGEIVGGTMDYLTAVKGATNFPVATPVPAGAPSHLAFFDYMESRYWEIPFNLFPRIMTPLALRRFRRSPQLEEFLRDPEPFRAKGLAGRLGRPVFLGYLELTDALGHQLGPEAVRRFMEKLGRMIAHIRERSAVPIDVILFSDHGNAPGVFAFCPVVDFLEGRGYRVRGVLEGPRDVVVPTFGLIDDVVLHSHPDLADALARDLSELEGVDLALYREEDVHGGSAREDSLGHGWPRKGVAGAYYVRRKKALARIRKDAWSAGIAYESISGDPLGYLPAVERLKRAGRLDARGFGPPDDWFRETADSTYPGAMERVPQAFEGSVENPATVLLSLAPGYYYGRWGIKFWTPLISTHGSLRREESMGFVMSTLGPLKPYVRHDRMLKLLLHRGES